MPILTKSINSSIIRKITFLFSFLILLLFLQSCSSFIHSQKTTSGEYRLAAVGDSITFGLGIKDRLNKSYPAQLGQLLGPRWVVGNFGRSGATLLSKGDRPYIRSVQYADSLRFQPHGVIIMLGTNDSKPQNSSYLNDFVSDYLQLIESFQSLESKPLIFICYPVPAFKGLFGIDNDVISGEILPAVKTVADLSGVYLIDLNTVLKSEDKHFPDSVHPDSEGARLIAEHIYTFLRENLSSSFYDHTYYYPLLSADPQK